MTTSLMTASLQPLAYILRFHPEGGLGDYAAWACTVIAREEVAFLAAAPGDPPAGSLDAIARALTAAGFTRVAWERRKEGQPVRAVGPYDLTRWLARRGGGVPAVQARVAELENALRPFADWYAKFGEDGIDPTAVAAFRRAAELVGRRI